MNSHLYHSHGDIEALEIDDINNRCLELASHIGSEEFEPKLRGVSIQVRKLLDDLDSFEPALERTSEDERLEIISDVESLKIPFELYPFSCSMVRFPKSPPINLAGNRYCSRTLLRRSESREISPIKH